MTKQINLTYCGMEGSGSTVKLAKQDAARKLEAMVERCRTSPSIVTVHGHVAMIVPNTYGWQCGIIADETGMRPQVCWNGQSETENESRDRAIHHMAQNAWNHDADDETFLTAIPASETIIRELRRYFLWQRAYRAARNAGMTDGQAHEHACRTA